MDLLFDFDKPAMGNDLLGRTEEINSLIDSIVDKRRGVVIYDAPKSGKNTLVCNALSRLKALMHKKSAHQGARRSRTNRSCGSRGGSRGQSPLTICTKKSSRNRLLFLCILRDSNPGHPD